METFVHRVSWRRRGVRNEFVGSLLAGEEGIRLSGRDPSSGIDVSLWIPRAEVAGVETDDLDVILELDGSESIYLRRVGGGSLDAQTLARELTAVRAGRARARAGRAAPST